MEALHDGDSDARARAARRLARDPGGRGGHIFNLGHGISQFTPPDNVSALVNAVHSHSRRLRQG